MDDQSSLATAVSLAPAQLSASHSFLSTQSRSNVRLDPRQKPSDFPLHLRYANAPATVAVAVPPPAAAVFSLPPARHHNVTRWAYPSVSAPKLWRLPAVAVRTWH